MADILHDFPVKVSADRVFEAVSAPALIDQWWTVRSNGKPVVGATYDLDFGPRYQWQAVVRHADPGRLFELEFTRADSDWMGTRLQFALGPSSLPGATDVHFAHRGWPTANEHYRVSCYCWAMYLRIMRRHLEHGEVVPYKARLDV